MSKLMLLNIQPDEERVAVVDEQVLTNLEIETSDAQTVKGNIYKGIIRKVEPSLQACFVDFGTSKNGFLPRNEIHPSLYDSAGKSGPPPVQEVFQEGQEVMVQVVRDAIGSKGVTFSTYITLAGRYMVMVSDTDRLAISRKLRASERLRIKKMADSFVLPEGYGIIIRTAAEDKTQKDITGDLDYLSRIIQAIHSRYDSRKSVGLIYREADLCLRFVRDHLTSDIDSVFVDNEEAYERAHNFMTHVMPASIDKLQLYRGANPIFTEYGIDEQVELTFNRQVPLPSGGHVCIDPTEALVSIDVNSGRTRTSDLEDTAFQTNLEACRAIAQQMVIRDVGGLVVIDFIDMRDSARRREIEKALRRAMGTDKANHRIGRISQFGLLELTRQRMRSTALQQSFHTCPTCEGGGLIRSTASSAMRILRQIQEAAAQKRANVLNVRIPVEEANFLQNRRRRFLASIEDHYRCHLNIQADPTIKLEDIVVESASMPREDLPVDRVIQVDPVDHTDDLTAYTSPTDEESVKVSWFKRIFGGGSKPANDTPNTGPARLTLLDEADDSSAEVLNTPVETKKIERQESSDSEESRSRDGNRRNRNRNRNRGRGRGRNRGPLVGGSAELLVSDGPKPKARTQTKDENPADTGDETTNVASDAAGETEQGDAPKKRRRRRRRRPSGRRPEDATQQDAADTADAVASSNSESSDATQGPAPTQSDAETATEKVDASSDVKQEGAEKKPARKRSRSRKKPAAKSTDGAQAESKERPAPAEKSADTPPPVPVASRWTSSSAGEGSGCVRRRPSVPAAHTR